jgi:uncharacterized membrane protein YdjX (TVP38/TMEM64 family)
MAHPYDCYLRDKHLEVRIPLILVTCAILGACVEGGSWTVAGYVVSSLLTFVLLTHRLHNDAAQWLHDNTDYSSGSGY